MFSDFLKKPKIHLYTICWNEEYMLKYFFKYYDVLVDRYVFFDNGSTDQTLDILKKHPKTEIRSLTNVENIDSYVLAAQQMHNTCWKESRGLADWVIITAVDEFLYAPNLKSYLLQCAKEGVTAIPALGFQMISRRLPSKNKSLLSLVKSGCPWTVMNKLSIFNPNKITETNQAVGRHTAMPSGEVKYPAKDLLLLLHYKYLSVEHTFNRHAELAEKLGSVDKENKWGYQYSFTREQFQTEWDLFEQNSVENIFSRKYDADLEHSPLEERWWRTNLASE
jgi:glycosyltransferase involved in cell wall biosynthesis